MKIKSGLKIRNIAGESIVMIRSNSADSTSRLLSFNSASVFLWESLVGKNFTEDDVYSLLMDKYDVDPVKAREDAAAWVSKLAEADVLD